MKTKIFPFITVLFALFSFNACNLDKEVDLAPEIIFSAVHRVDTLKVGTINQVLHQLDTITAGDTINFRLLLIGYNNNLKTFYLRGTSENFNDSINSKIIIDAIKDGSINDTTKYESINDTIKIIYSEESYKDKDSIFSSTSKYDNGDFYFNSNIKNISFPFKYIVVKPEFKPYPEKFEYTKMPIIKETSLTFTVVSDAVFENGTKANVSTVILKIPIRDSIIVKTKRQ